MRADDALTAISHGADAIIVSNHGARQLDGVLATIDALSSIVEAVSASGKKVRVAIYFLRFRVTHGCNRLSLLWQYGVSKIFLRIVLVMW